MYKLTTYIYIHEDCTYVYMNICLYNYTEILRQSVSAWKREGSDGNRR